MINKYREVNNILKLSYLLNFFHVNVIEQLYNNKKKQVKEYPIYSQSEKNVKMIKECFVKK